MSWRPRDHWNRPNQWTPPNQQQVLPGTHINHTQNGVPLYQSNSPMPPPFLLPPWHKMNPGFNSNMNMPQSNNFNVPVHADPARENNASQRFKKPCRSDVADRSRCKSRVSASLKRKRKKFNKINSSETSSELRSHTSSDPSDIKFNKSKTNVPVSKRIPWSRIDALSALKLERTYQEFRNKLFIKITFPDQILDSKTVMTFHPNIRSVAITNHYAKPRQVLVKVKQGVDLDKIVADLNNKKLDEYGGDCLKAERIPEINLDNIPPEQIDPYTIYIGNLPLTFGGSLLKKEFPESTRRDLGYSKKLKSTRYAFLRFSCISDAFEAFKKAVLINIADAAVIVRFKRIRLGSEPAGASFSDEDSEKYLLNVQTDEDEVESTSTDLDFGFKPDFWEAKSTKSLTYRSMVSASMDDQDTETSAEEEEFDQSELNPKPRLSETMKRFIKSSGNDEDYDIETDLPVVPSDVTSEMESTDTSKFDSPY